MLFLAFGVMAAVAFWATWQDRDLFWVGFWLMAGWAISNLLDWYAPLPWQVGGYTAIEVLVATAAICSVRRHGKGGPLTIVALNLMSIGVNFFFAKNYIGERQQVFVWEGTTNAIFAAECLIATGVGIAYAIRTGRVPGGIRFRRDDAAPGLGRKGHRP